MALMIRKLADKKLRRFLLVGLVNTAFSTAMMFGFYNVLSLGYWGSSSLSFLLASILSYFLNRRYTFGSHAGHALAALRFAVNIGVCYCIAYLIAKPLTRLSLEAVGSLVSTAFYNQISMLAGMGFFTCMNYFGQRFFVFPEEHQKTHEAFPGAS
ncbi:MAG: GtrA family protein [Peptococcaceae bacterium]|jgi:putative flippase GtrA|nr:GtrA family protein [Peptococcaceae bacterium]